jgi:hypothetical protein
VAVGGAGCTLVRQFFDDDGPVEDGHFAPADLGREREAARLVQEARDSFLRPDFRGDAQ